MQLPEILSRTEPPEDARATMEFEKMRFELAWRYFDLHARQRTLLFHFFILLSPFMLGGCFYLFREREVVGYLPGEFASLAGALLAVLFFGLDRRNRKLVHVGERAIRLVEEQFLFTEFRSIDMNGSHFRGVLSTEKSENAKRRLSVFRGHAFLMGAVYWIEIVAFAALLGYFIAVQTGGLVLPKPIPTQSPHASQT